MDRAKRKARFQDQEYASVKEKAGPRQTDDDRDQVVTLSSRKRNHANRDARCDKHSQAQVESDHASLQYARAAGEFVELLKDYPLSFGCGCVRAVPRHAFEPIGQEADTVHDAPKAS